MQELWSQRFCFPIKLPGEAYAAGLQMTLRVIGLKGVYIRSSSEVLAFPMLSLTTHRSVTHTHTTLT